MFDSFDDYFSVAVHAFSSRLIPTVQFDLDFFGVDFFAKQVLLSMASRWLQIQWLYCLSRARL